MNENIQAAVLVLGIFCIGLLVGLVIGQMAVTPSVEVVTAEPVMQAGGHQLGKEIPKSGQVQVDCNKGCVDDSDCIQNCGPCHVCMDGFCETVLEWEKACGAQCCHKSQECCTYYPDGMDELPQKCCYYAWEGCSNEGCVE